MKASSINETLDRSISRFDPSAGGILAIDPFTRLFEEGVVEDTTGISCEGSCIPCGSYCDDLAMSPFADNADVFNLEYPQDDLLLSIAGAPHTISRRQAASLYPIDDPRTPKPLAVVQLPPRLPGEIFAIAPTLVLHTRDASMDPLAVMTVQLQAVRDGDDIAIKATPMGAYVKPNLTALEGSCATVMGYLTGMKLGDFAKGFQFDDAKRMRIYQILPEEDWDSVDPEAETFDARELEQIVMNRFAATYPMRTLSDDDVEMAQMAIDASGPFTPGLGLADVLRSLEPRRGRDDQALDQRTAKLAGLDLHWNVPDMYAPAHARRMRAFRPRARELDGLFPGT